MAFVLTSATTTDGAVCIQCFSALKVLPWQITFLGACTNIFKGSLLLQLGKYCVGLVSARLVHNPPLMWIN